MQESISFPVVLGVVAHGFVDGFPLLLQPGRILVAAHFPLQFAVTLPARWIETAGFQSRAHRTAGLVGMRAVSEFTSLRQVGDFLEDLIERALGSPKLQLPHARSVDNRAAFGKR